MIGWQTRIAAILFAGFSVMSAVLFHADFSDPNQMIHFMKNISITGGFLFLIVHGAGNYSLDSREKAHQRWLMSLGLVLALHTLAKCSNANKQGKHHSSKYECVCVWYALTAK